MSSAPLSERKVAKYTVDKLDGPDEHQPKADGVAWYVGSLILVNALVGAGILNFPYSMHAAGGLAVSVGVQLVLIAMLWSAITSMVWCSDMSGTLLYQDTVAAYLGDAGKFVCSGAMLVYCFLITTTYLVAIGQQMSQGVRIMTADVDAEFWFTSHAFVTAVCSAVVVFPFCLVKSIDKLCYASAFASLSVLLVVCIVIFEFFETDHSHVVLRYRPENWTDVFLSVPAYAVAYMFDLCSVAVYGRLKKRSVRVYVHASALALVIVFLFYNVFAAFAYASFGAAIKPNFMTNYRATTWVVALAQVAYSAKLCLEYPIYQYLGWTALETFAAACRRPSSERDGNCGRGLSSACWLLCSAAVALLAPNINYVLPLASAVVLHFQLTFPGLCLLRAGQIIKNRISATRLVLLRCFAVFLIATGLSLSSILIAQYLKENTRG